MSDIKIPEGSSEYYVRTDMGEFRVISNDDLIASWMSGDCKAPIPVVTLTGFICKIRACDIKTIGLLEDYLGVLNKGKEVKEIKNIEDYDSVKFAYSNKTGLVRVNVMNSKSAEPITIDFHLEQFAKQVIDELPNAVLDAILDEKEQRSYS